MVAVGMFSAVGEGVLVRVCVAVPVPVGDGSVVALMEAEYVKSGSKVVFEMARKPGASQAESRKSKMVRIKQVKGRFGFILIFFVMFTG